jgi:hypothetical protein
MRSEGSEGNVARWQRSCRMLSASIRLYTYRELCQLFEEVGFVDCEGYGSLSQEPFKLGSQRFYMAATKKAV